MHKSRLRFARVGNLNLLSSKAVKPPGKIRLFRDLKLKYKKPNKELLGFAGVMFL